MYVVILSLQKSSAHPGNTLSRAKPLSRTDCAIYYNESGTGSSQAAWSSLVCQASTALAVPPPESLPPALPSSSFVVRLKEINHADSHDPHPLFSASYSHEVLATEGSIFLSTAVWTGGALCALASLLHRTQQFQKNAYHNDKHLISET